MEEDCPVIALDALALLKEDKTLIDNQALIINGLGEKLKEKEPVESELEGGGSTWWTVCGDCHGAIDEDDLYCKHCGRQVKRE